MLFSPFIHDLCFPSPFIILLLPLFVDLSYLLLLFVDLSYLLLLFVDLSRFIALFTFPMHLWILYCDYPFPRVLVRQILSSFGGVRKTSNEAVTTMLVYEVFDPKNTYPCVNIVIYRFIYILLCTCEYYIVIIPSPCVLVRQNPSGFGGSCKSSLRPWQPC